ncbi:MAG: bifunctional methionine sulfoxide reductase B/A protein [Methanobacteriaceae archaeon]
MKKLTDKEKEVILSKGTEAPFTGKYNNHFTNGTYICKQCGTPLYKSSDKFQSSCGWPAFDDEIPEAIKKIVDADGSRTEILCNNCNAHLGHVFKGENLTPKNTRHCVNSISLDFKEGKNDTDISADRSIDNNEQDDNKTVYFGGGCFWGVEYYFKKQEGVISVESGFMGGKRDNPSYNDVCYNNTGEIEVVKIVYNPQKVDYELLAKLFFEIHDPCQENRQGPDFGHQYRSQIFYTNSNQKEISENLVEILKNKGFDVKTKIEKAMTFYKAEEYHQNYYGKNGQVPYCHIPQKRF